MSRSQKTIKYNLGDGSLRDQSELIHEAFERAKDLPADIQGPYIDTIKQTFGHFFMKDKWKTVYTPLIGIGLLLLVVVLSILLPYPSNFQGQMIRALLAVGGGIAGAMIPGFIEFKYTNWLRAGGAFVVLCMFYLLNSPNENFAKKGPPFNFFVFATDTVNYEKIVDDFDANSTTSIKEYSVKSIGDFYGNEIASDSFCFYRLSDGKVYINETCRDVTEQSMIVIANALITNSRITKRQAFISCKQKLGKKN